MSLHHELPIYRDAYQLMKLSAEVTREFRRDFKNTLGQTLRDECIGMGILILRANTAKGETRVVHIEKLLESVEMVQLTLRLALDLRLVSRKQYSDAVQLVGSVGKQAGGWKKSTASPVAPPSRR